MPPVVCGVHRILGLTTSTHPFSYPAPTIRKPQIEDARSKIIQKNRAKIRDVRDLISAKKKPADARYVITKNMTDRLGKMGIAAVRAGGAVALPRPRHHEDAYEYEQDPYLLDARSADYLVPPHFSPTKHRQSQYAKSNYTGRARAYHDLDLLEPPPRRRSYVDYDAVEDTQPLSSREAPEFDMLFKEYMSTKSGGSSVAPPPRYKPSSTMDEDVFDLYEAPSRDRRPLPPPPTLSSQRRFIPPEETHLSYEMRSRLEGSQSQPKSMGIFANPTKPLTQTSNNKGYRVMVTNLHSSVTVWDIQELFADIGGLISAEIVKPGVAEVVYKTMKDAEDAVEVYHNRQLDGQPMKCHMITPTVAPLHHSSSSSSNMRKAPLELDLDTLHSALFTSKRH